MKLYIQMMSSYAPSWGFGGPIKIFFDYAYHLQKYMKTFVVAGDVHHDYSKFNTALEIEGISIIRVRLFLRHLARWNINLVSPWMFFIVLRQIKLANSRVTIHICETRGLINIYAAILKKIFGEKVTLVHSAFGMLHEKKSKFRSAYDALIFDWTFRQVDIFLAQNDNEFSEYKNLGVSRPASHISEKRLELLPLNVDRPERIAYISKSKSLSTSARKFYGIPKDEIVCLFLGRFHINKGILNAHRAALEYSTISRRKVCMVFAGRDEGALSEIKSLQMHNYGDLYHVKILENVYGENRFKLYQAADVFLGFPLICEETMLASLESISVGTPCIVSKCNASIPFIAHSFAGYESDATPKEAAVYIGKILEDYPTHSAAAVRLVNRKFLTPQVIRELASILR